MKTKQENLNTIETNSDYTNALALLHEKESITKRLAKIKQLLRKKNSAILAAVNHYSSTSVSAQFAKIPKQKVKEKLVDPRQLSLLM